jgi:hypothetical protein
LIRGNRKFFLEVPAPEMGIYRFTYSKVKEMELYKRRCQAS